MMSPNDTHNAFWSSKLKTAFVLTHATYSELPKLKFNSMRFLIFGIFRSATAFDIQIQIQNLIPVHYNLFW